MDIICITMKSRGTKEESHEEHEERRAHEYEHKAHEYEHRAHEEHYAEHTEHAGHPKKVESKEYEEYIAKHGWHFNEALAEWASKQMKKASGDQTHHWTAAEVKAAFERLGLMKPEKVTWGDATYSANMAYADYYGISLKTDVDCIKHAYADIADPDGYPEKVFAHWCANVEWKQINVPWGNYL